MRNRAAASARPATVVVTEVYQSVQGESTWVGAPCVFIRLTGCPLRCVWCDTTYAFSGGKRRLVDEVAREALGYGCPVVEITGGEPLAQRGCGPLAHMLLDAGLTVLCETSGALPIDRAPQGVIRIMDLKCPGSGEVARNDWRNIELLRPADEVKFVIADRADYEWSREVVARYTLASRCNAVLFSPVFGAVDPRDLVAWILDDRLPVRFQLQLHKFVWPPEQKGV